VPYLRLPHWKRFIFYSYIYVCIYLLKSNHVEIKILLSSKKKKKKKKKEKKSILPFIISATGIVPESLFKNLKILDLENTLLVEIQKGILLYSCHIVRKFLNIDTEHKTQKSQNVEARRR
jgi:hypothetical protein